MGFVWNYNLLLWWMESSYELPAGRNTSGTLRLLLYLLLLKAFYVF
jgi:hypothetical protein